MGNCHSSMENLRKHNSKISLSKENNKMLGGSSSSLPILSSKGISKNPNYTNLKKYNSLDETFSNQNSHYILPERIAKREDITKKYKISRKILGDGATSIVYLAENSSKKKFAIKCIPKDKIEYQKKVILKEAEICLKLNNKNIIKYYEIYEDNNFVSVVMEPGVTDLFELIVNSPLGYIPEEIAIDFLIQIFEVIDYLHSSLNIVHCDIKPENFVVLVDKENGNRPMLKLIDFGNVRRKPQEKERLFDFCGTKEYMAPEAFEKEGFNEKVDEWAAGVIMFNMLTGADPFISQNDSFSEYKDNIKFKEIKFEYIKNEKLRELNKKLLNRYLCKRITAKEALAELKRIKNDSFYNNNIKQYEKNCNIISNKLSFINIS